MMEHTTDRLFWTLTSIIVGALILTIGINAFPQATRHMLNPVSNVMTQSGNVTKTGDDATKHPTDFSLDEHNTSSSNHSDKTPSSDKSKKDTSKDTHSSKPTTPSTPNDNTSNPTNPSGK